MKRNIEVNNIAWISMVAAIYTAISLGLAPLSFGAIQARLAEALIVVVLFRKETILSLTIGCLLTNLLGAFFGLNPIGLIDAVFGTFATFLSCVCAYQLRAVTIKGVPLYSLMMPVIFNAIIIGLELTLFVYGQFDWLQYLIFAGEVFAGQFISCVIIGIPLYNIFKKMPIFQ